MNIDYKTNSVGPSAQRTLTWKQKRIQFWWKGKHASERQSPDDMHLMTTNVTQPRTRINDHKFHFTTNETANTTTQYTSTTMTSDTFELIPTSQQQKPKRTTSGSLTRCFCPPRDHECCYYFNLRMPSCSSRKINFALTTFKDLLS